MEFSVSTFFTVVFWLLSPFIFFAVASFIINRVIAIFFPRTSLQLKSAQVSTPSNLKDKTIEQDNKKNKTAWQKAVEIQKKENARQAALARQAEQARIAAEQRASYPKCFF